MAARWLPNSLESFSSPLIASLIENAERQFSSACNDTSEFLLRCLDEYERTFQLYSQELGKTMVVYLLCKMLWQTLRTFAILCPFFDRCFSGDNLVWDNDCSLTESGRRNVGSIETEHSQNESPDRPRLGY